MQIIQELTEKIDSELKDAEKYIKCALKHKDEYPQVAEAYYRLSLEEMKHADMLHDEVVKIITEYKREHEIPPAMKSVYDYLHDKQIKYSSKIKSKQDSFK